MSVKRWHRSGWWGMILVLAACGGTDGGTDVVEPPEVQPFVGFWEAEELTITLDADTTVVFDLFDYNGRFTFRVEPSGTYTASLSFEPDSTNFFASSEVGRIAVSGGFLTLRPTGGAPATSEYTFLAEDRLRIEGPTEFDFNFDQEGDPARLRAVLQRQ